jgi:hypothetical protein
VLGYILIKQCPGTIIHENEGGKSIFQLTKSACCQTTTKFKDFTSRIMDRIHEIIEPATSRQAAARRAANPTTLLPRLELPHEVLNVHLDHSRGLPGSLPPSPARALPPRGGRLRDWLSQRARIRHRDERHRCRQADPADGAVHPPGG